MQINNEINHWMIFRGINQTTLCRNIGINIKSFNSFIKGKRPIPAESLAKAMEHLSITFGKSGEDIGNVRASKVNKIIMGIAKDNGYTMNSLSKKSNVSESTISRFMSGKCGCSSKTLEKLISTLNISIIEYEDY